MQLRELSLSNFRNYPLERFSFDSRTNIIHGMNAQGKTNVLEAIYLLATLQSFRFIDNQGMISWNQTEAQLDGVVSDGDLEKSFRLILSPKAKKPHINGNSVRRIADYFGHIPVISFHPLDLQILQGGPRLRRRYLDRALFAIDPVFAIAIGKYSRALLQRNAALRFDRPELVHLWGEKLAELGGTVLLKRLLFLKKLNTLTACLYREISGSPLPVDLHYETSLEVGTQEAQTEPFLQAKLAEQMNRMQVAERKQRRTLVGPHRDDFTVLLDGRDLRRFGSQGEQRTAVLALKLSEAALWEEEKGGSPIFLMDDIASELDHSRKTFLFDVLKKKNMQIFVTTTDADSLRCFHPDGAYFKVDQGKVLCD